MRTLLISSHFPKIFGGVSDYAYHLSRALKKENWEVFVLTSKNDNIIEDKDIFILPVVEIWGFCSLVKIFREIKRINPNGIILLYVPYMYNPYGIPFYLVFLAILLRFSGFKFLTNFQEIAIRLDIKRPKYFFIGLLQRLIAYNLCLFSNRIVVSIDFWQKMLWFFSKKIEKIPIGSNILPVEISDTGKRELKKSIASGEEVILCNFGTDFLQRRNDVLLRAVSLYNSDFLPKVKLLFIGKFSQNSIGRLKKLAEELKIKENIYFTGYLKEDDVYKHLLISDIFVIFDVGEKEGEGGISTKSGSVAAAYAAGLPIIGNKGDMTNDFFKHRENIYLLNSLSEEEIVNAIQEVINNHELKEKLRNNAIKTYQENLDWQIIAKKYIYAMSNM